MNLVIILLIFAVASVFITPSFADASVMVFTHVKITDNQDHLVTSIIPTKIGYTNENELDNFLNYVSTPNDPIKTINNQKIQIIQREATVNFDSTNVISDTTLNSANDDGGITTLVRLIHDGIPVVDGDKLTITWTFIRSLD